MTRYSPFRLLPNPFLILEPLSNLYKSTHWGRRNGPDKSLLRIAATIGRIIPWVIKSWWFHYPTTRLYRPATDCWASFIESVYRKRCRLLNTEYTCPLSGNQFPVSHFLSSLTHIHCARQAKRERENRGCWIWRAIRADTFRSWSTVECRGNENGICEQLGEGWIGLILMCVSFPFTVDGWMDCHGALSCWWHCNFCCSNSIALFVIEPTDISAPLLFMRSTLVGADE